MPTPNIQREGALRIQVSLADLPNSWRAILRWGPCFCRALDGETCRPVPMQSHINAGGLDWETEYERAINAGEAIRL